MKLSQWERRMLHFLECPATFDLILIEFSFNGDTKRQRPIIERRLSNLITKGLITQKGKYYETKILLSASDNSR